MSLARTAASTTIRAASRSRSCTSARHSSPGCSSSPCCSPGRKAWSPDASPSSPRRSASISSPCRSAKPSPSPSTTCTAPTRAADALAALPLAARPRSDLLLRLLLARLPDPGAHRPARDPSRFRPLRGHGPDTDHHGALAGPVAALAFVFGRRALRARLGGPGSLGPPHDRRLAARHLRPLHGPLPFLRGRRAGLLLLPVRRNAPRGGLPLRLLRARRNPTRARRTRSPVPPRPLPPRLGMVPDLPRVRDP